MWTWRESLESEPRDARNSLVDHTPETMTASFEINPSRSGTTARGSDRMRLKPPSNGTEAPERSRWPMFFARIVERRYWDAEAIDLGPDARAWPELPEERRGRLTTLLAGFCVAEEAVSEHLTPFGSAAEATEMASDESLVAWCFCLQRRDEARHARLFDRIAAEVLGLPGATPGERREAARAHVPAAVLELFEQRLPTMAAELGAGHAGLAEGVALYHMVLEGIVFDAGQRALLDDLDDGALPGVREGGRRVELDERWHVGFGLRCLMEAQPTPEVIDDLLAHAEDASAAWGDAVPSATRRRSVLMCSRRLSAAGLIGGRTAAA
jgi:ribonucleoside-diphosphate reductase beta chain